MALSDLQQTVSAALEQAQAEGEKLGYDSAVADFYGQNAAFLLANIFADSLEAAAGRLASHDQGFAASLHTFAAMMRAAVNQPSVTTTTPAPGATGDPTSITVKFSEDMDPASIVPGSFTLTDAGASVSVLVAYDSQTRTATLTPTVAITAGDAVSVTVGAVRNTQGVAQSSPYQFSFTAAAPAAAAAPKAAPKKR